MAGLRALRRWKRPRLDTCHLEGFVFAGFSALLYISVCQTGGQLCNILNFRGMKPKQCKPLCSCCGAQRLMMPRPQHVKRCATVCLQLRGGDGPNGIRPAKARRTAACADHLGPLPSLSNGSVSGPAPALRRPLTGPGGRTRGAGPGESLSLRSTGARGENSRGSGRLWRSSRDVQHLGVFPPKSFLRPPIPHRGDFPATHVAAFPK